MEDIKATRAQESGFDEKDAVPTYTVGSDSGHVVNENVDDLKRRLTGRQIQMITIGGSIGTALFVSIGTGLTTGGPGSLLIAFFMYSCFLAAVNNCMAEMAGMSPYICFERCSLVISLRVDAVGTVMGLSKSASSGPD